MLEHAVVGLDLSPATEDLQRELPHLHQLGVRKLSLVNALGGPYPQAPELRHREHYQARLETLAHGLEQFEVHVEVRDGRPADELRRAADEACADVIVVGSRGHTPWRDLFLGSTVLDLARTSRRPLLLLPSADPVPNAVAACSSPPMAPPAHELQNGWRYGSDSSSGARRRPSSARAHESPMPPSSRQRRTSNSSSARSSPHTSCVAHFPRPSESSLTNSEPTSSSSAHEDATPCEACSSAPPRSTCFAPPTVPSCSSPIPTGTTVRDVAGAQGRQPCRVPRQRGQAREDLTYAARLPEATSASDATPDRTRLAGADQAPRRRSRP
jgi:nucleotide-binding universal stress UspA family protein